MKILVAVLLVMMAFATPLYGYQVYETINYQGAIYTKEYVLAYMPDGRRVFVPVINGCFPNIVEYYNSGNWYRNYSYDVFVKQEKDASVPEIEPILSVPEIEPISEKLPTLEPEEISPGMLRISEFGEPENKITPKYWD